MDAHRLTSVQLTQFYLHRIKKLNPKLNAVITVSPTALADARAADAARRGGDDLPLLGIPVIVKDNVNTTGMPTTGRLVGACRQHAGGRVHRPTAEGRRRDRSSPRPTCPSGRTSGRSRRRAAGAGSAARRTWPTCSIAIRAARAPAPASRVRPTSHRRRRHRDRRLDRLPRRARTGSSASSRPSGSSSRAGVDPDLGRPGHRRADGPQRDRRRRPARRDDRHRPGRPGDGRAGRPRLHRLHPVPRRRRARRRPDRRLARAPTTRRPADAATSRSSKTRSTRSRRRRDGHRPRQRSRSTTASTPEFAALLCEFKTDSRPTSRPTPAPAIRRRSRT